MKSKVILFHLVLFIIIIFVYFTKEGTMGNKFISTKGAGSQITTSFYPLYYFTTQIVEGDIKVENLTPAGSEPHDFEPTPQDIVRLQKSKLLIINGAGFEPWVEKLSLDLQENNVKVVATTEGVNLQEGEEEHEHEHESEESSKDPHIWLSPKLAKIQVEKILQGILAVDPDIKDRYEKNAQKLKDELDELDKKYEIGLNSCKRKSFVTSHSAFGYLAREYGLEQVSISGLSPEEEPSPYVLAGITDYVRDNNVEYIFFETLVSPKLSETIANEVGAQTLVLDPLEGLSDDDIKEGKNYFTVMESNLKNLQIALECNN